MTYHNIYAFFIQKRVIASFLVLCACNLLLAESIREQSEDPKKIWKVVIDPGHGGKDPGALGTTSKEKDIVLSVALKLGNYISENFEDVEVLYTRKSDEFIELYKRADIANKAKADLFISLHTNSWKTTKPVGSETYVMGLHTDEKNLAVAMKENAVITFEEDYTTKYEGYDPKSPESFIIFSLMQNTYLEQSLNFASHVQTQFKDRAKRIDRGVIILIDNKTGEISEVMSRLRKPVDDTSMMFSRPVVDRVIREGKAVIISDVDREDVGELTDTLKLLKIGSVMCVPLFIRSKIRGVIYVDTMKTPYGFRKEDAALFTSLSGPAAIAIENALLLSRKGSG